MNEFEKLIAYFEGFPGIGARQARRFAFHLLTLPKSSTDEISTLIANLRHSVKECESCKRFFSPYTASAVMCDICADAERDITKLMIVERDSDIRAIERSGTYNGLYFVLGGTVPLFEAKEQIQLRGGALKHRITESDFDEVILAFSVNPDGENTIRYIQKLLADLQQEKTFSVSILGRGLSTGSELEYADPETIKYALSNRTRDAL